MRLMVICLFWCCFVSLSAEESLATLINNGELSKVEKMLKAQPELLEKRFGYSRTPLLLAASSNQTQLLSAILALGPNVKAVDRNQKTAIHLAAEKNMLEYIPVLAKAGVDINAVDSSAYTALAKAISRRNKALVKALLDAGADPLKYSGHRKSALHDVLYARDMEMAKLVIEAVEHLGEELKRDPQLVARAIDNSRSDTFSLLLPHIDVKEFKLDDGRTHLLHAAARRNRLKAVKAIVERGVSIELAMQPGQTPLYYAVSGRAYAVIDYLLQQKADMYAASGEKQASIIANIVSRNDFESLLLFLKHGYEVNRLDHNGLSALHHAADDGRFGLATILLQNDADINIVSKEGLSPLAIAMQRQRDFMVSMLRERDAKLIGPAFKLAQAALRNDRKSEALMHLKNFKPGDSVEGMELCVSEAFARGAIDCLAVIKQAGFSLSSSEKGRDYLYSYFSRAKCQLEDIKKLHKIGYDFKESDARSSIMNRILYRRESTVIRNGSSRDPETGAELLKIAAFLVDQDVISKEKSYGSFVMDALDRRDTEFAELLIEKGFPFLGKRDTIASVAARYRRKPELIPWVLGQLAKTEKSDVVFNLAVQMGGIDLLQKIYNPETMDIDAQDKEGYTPLILAVKGKNTDAVKWLLEKGADVNKQNHKKDFYGSNDSSTPVLAAILNGDLEMLNLLFKSEADPNAVGGSGLAPIHIALQRRELEEILPLLLKHGADANLAVKSVNQHQSYLGYTPMHFLANKSYKSIEAVKPTLDLLLKHGASLASKDKNGKSPIDLAVSRSNFYFLKASAGHDQSIDQTDLEKAEILALLQKRQVVPIEAMLAKNPDLIKVLISDRKQLSNIIRSKSKEIMQLLIKHEPDFINQKNEYTGKTLLMDYVQRFDHGAVEFLLEFNPDLNSVDANAWTALHHAEHNVSRSPKANRVVTLLTNAGAKPTGISQTQWSVLAALRYKRRGNLEIVLNNWDALEQWPAVFEPPLVLAAQAKDYDMFGELLARGMDPNVKDKRGTPVLFKVISDRRIQALKALLEKKVDLTVTDANGTGLEAYVQRSRDTFIAELLNISLEKTQQKQGKQESLIKEIKKEADPIDDF